MIDHEHVKPEFITITMDRPTAELVQRTLFTRYAVGSSFSSAPAEPLGPVAKEIQRQLNGWPRGQWTPTAISGALCVYADLADDARRVANLMLSGPYIAYGNVEDGERADTVTFYYDGNDGSTRNCTEIPMHRLGAPEAEIRRELEAERIAKKAADAERKAIEAVQARQAARDAITRSLTEAERRYPGLVAEALELTKTDQSKNVGEVPA